MTTSSIAAPPETLHASLGDLYRKLQDHYRPEEWPHFSREAVRVFEARIALRELVAAGEKQLFEAISRKKAAQESAIREVLAAFAHHASEGWSGYVVAPGGK